MKISPPCIRSARLRFFTTFALAFAIVSAAFAQSTVTGSVSNAATRSFLTGAQVTLAGTTESAFTDRDGRFELTTVAPGSYTLEVTYTGLDRVTQPLLGGTRSRPSGSARRFISSLRSP